MLKRLGFLLPHLGVLGLLVPLVGAFVVQFALGEFPCPLCLIQRMAMLLTALGPASILLAARRGEVTAADMARGGGLSVIAAAAGACVSARQVLLHIAPGDPGYGGDVLGLHLYTWALVVFGTVVVVAGLGLVFARELAPGKTVWAWPSKIVLGLLAAVILANVIVAFVQEGFHATIPDDPVRYELLSDLERLWL